MYNVYGSDEKTFLFKAPEKYLAKILRLRPEAVARIKQELGFGANGVSIHFNGKPPEWLDGHESVWIERVAWFP